MQKEGIQNVIEKIVSTEPSKLLSTYDEIANEYDSFSKGLGFQDSKVLARYMA